MIGAGFVFLVFSLLSGMLCLLVLERIYFTMDMRDSGSPTLTYILGLLSPITYAIGLAEWTIKSQVEIQPD
jgi:hypothetical protein